MVTQGLREARKRSAMLRANFLRSCYRATRRKPVIGRPGKSRSSHASIGLHYPVPPKPRLAFHSQPSNVYVGPLFRTGRKTNIDPLETRAPLSDARDCRSRA